MATDTQVANPQKFDWINLGWEVIKGIAVAIAAVFSFWASQKSGLNSDALEKLRIGLASRAQQSELDIKVYELVEKALSLEGTAARGHGLAAAALINALTVPPLRDQLLNALRAGSKDEALIKQLDDTLKFDDLEGDLGPGPAPTSRAADPGRTSRWDRDASYLTDALNLVAPVLAQALPGALKGYRVDIFYCETQSSAVTEARRQRALRASERLKPSGADVIVRVRNVPTLVQARPGYKSVSDEIRFNDQPKERAAAKQLATTIGIRPENLRKIDSQTLGYISVFYCE